MIDNLYVTCISDKGVVRHNNEDNYCVNGMFRALLEESAYCSHIFSSFDEAIVFAVFDGMGGEQNGEYASYEAANILSQVETKPDDILVTEYLEEIVNKMNRAVCEKTFEMKCSRMGSTAVICCVENNILSLCNIGDSRGYRLRDGELFQMSLDHCESLVHSIDKKAALTQHLGIDSEEFEIVPHIISSEMKSGDVYLLCSDGLTDMVSTSDIKAIMNKSQDSNSLCNELVNKALSNGGKDNITVLVAVVQ